MFVYNSTGRKYIKAEYPCFIINNKNNVSDWILNSGIPEQSLIDWSREFITKDKIFIDVGAHMGTYTINLAPYCKHVYSFEAQKMTYYQLCGGIALNELENVTAYNYGIGNKEESHQMKTLQITTEDGGGTTLDEEVINSTKRPVINKLDIEMRSIDDFNINDNIGLIKIDVEGYELNVIKGAEDTLKRCNYPPLLFEAWEDKWYEERKKNLFNYIENLGYKIHMINGYEFMFLAIKTN